MLVRPFGIFEEAQAGLEPYPRPRCWSRSRLVVPLSMIVDSTLISCLSWGPSLHPSSQVIRYRKFVRPHAMLLLSPNRFLVSVNQDSPSREGRAVDFRLSRSRHSRNSPVHRSREYASSQHIANEKSVHPGFSSSIKMSRNLSLFIRSKSPRAPLRRGAPC